MAKQTVLITKNITTPDANGNPALLLDEAGNPYSVTFETIVGPPGPQGPSGIGDAKVSNVYGESTTDGYTQDYLNKELDKKQPKGNYLTEHQDISGKADTTYVDKELDKKLDKTEHLDFNQILDPDTKNNLVNSDGITYERINGGYHIYGTRTASASVISIYSKPINLNPNHKYYISLCEKGNDPDGLIYIACTRFNGETIYLRENSQITTNLKSINSLGHIMVQNDVVDYTTTPVVVDLTEMFGKGNEPQKVVEAQKYIEANKYYPYQMSNIDLTENKQQTYEKKGIQSISNSWLRLFKVNNKKDSGIIYICNNVYYNSPGSLDMYLYNVENSYNRSSFSVRRIGTKTYYKTVVEAFRYNPNTQEIEVKTPYGTGQDFSVKILPSFDFAGWANFQQSSMTEDAPGYPSVLVDDAIIVDQKQLNSVSTQVETNTSALDLLPVSERLYGTIYQSNKTITIDNPKNYDVVIEFITMANETTVKLNNSSGTQVAYFAKAYKNLKIRISPNGSVQASAFDAKAKDYYYGYFNYNTPNKFSLDIYDLCLLKVTTFRRMN